MTKLLKKCFSNAFRSSVKYNIPARTLRDWMKRMNIKSVFTHNNGSSETKSLVHKGGEPGFKTGSSLDLRNNSTESNDCSDISSVASSSNNSESSTTASVFPDAQLKVSTKSNNIADWLFHQLVLLTPSFLFLFLLTPLNDLG